MLFLHHLLLLSQKYSLQNSQEMNCPAYEIQQKGMRNEKMRT